ncbi:uncharacterized protein LOC108738948 isoform X2 [Agrilus planipennis]|uniref:Uncharacterized protein LOC108738948 isoform X2 n=1 Tax=Agrilus planipennis TaxID=224129 RepID=A0A1W4WW38_AGRPL|nr:uncharacterized protein LOC108738948 isoform X2 [Agrilus planipennis]
MDTTESTKVTSSAIEFYNLPIGTDRNQVYKEFGQFGEICKLYINNSEGYGNVYFVSEKCAQDAYNSLSINSRLNIGLKPPVAAIVRRKVKPEQSESSVSSDLNSFTMYQDYDDDFLASEGPSLVDVFGNPITTLQDDDGTIYVPIKQIKKMGVKFFDASMYPPPGYKLKNNKAIIEQFELYMQLKARKFLIQNRIVLDESIVNDSIESCKRSVFESSYKQNDLSPNQLTRSMRNNRGRSMQNNELEDSYKRSQSRNRRNNQNANRNQFRNENHQPQPQQHQSRHVDFSFSPNQQKSSNNNYNNRNQFANNDQASQMRRPRTNQIKNVQQNISHLKDEKKQESFVQNRTKSDNTTNWNSETKPSISEKVTGVKTTPIVSPSNDNNTEDISNIKTKETIKLVELELRKDLMVAVQHVESDSVGWVTLEDNEEILQKITMDILEEVQNANTVKPIVGGIYAAMFDSLWFRAVVQEVLPSLKVHFIDFGNTSTVSEVKQLSERLQSIPAQAIKIRLKTSSKKKLNVDDIFKIKPILKEDNNTYVIEVVNNEVNQHMPPAKFKTDEPLPKDIEIENESLSISSASENIDKTTPGSIIYHISPGESGALEVNDIMDNGHIVAFFTTEKFVEKVCSLDTLKPGKELNQATVGDLVVVNYEESYARGRIVEIKDKRFKVALIDYGTILETKDVKKLPSEFYKIPEFTCVCIVNPGLMSDIKLGMTINVTVLPNNKVKLLNMGLDNKKNEATVLQWNPAESLGIDLDQKQYYWRDLANFQLQDNTVVAIFAENDGFLMLRTRESIAKLKEICNYLKSYKAEPLDRKPQIGELLLHIHSDNVLYRVVTTEMKGDTIDIHFIDYGHWDTCTVENLRKVDKTLASYENTLIKTRLTGFQSFDKAQVEELKKCKENKEKFKAVFVREDKEVELKSIDGGANLSDRLKKLTTKSTSTRKASSKTPEKEKSPKVSPTKLSEIPKPELPSGKQQVICLATNNINEGIVVFCDTVVEILTTIQTAINEYMESDPPPYQPQESLEVVLAYFEDDWYRAMNLSEKGEENHELLFIDYGNCASVDPAFIRKIPSNLVQFPRVARFCYLKDVKVENEAVLNVVKELISENSMYEVEFINQEEDGVYNVIIPLVMDTLKKKKLL